MEAVGDLFGGVQQLFRQPMEQDILPPMPKKVLNIKVKTIKYAVDVL